MICVALIYNIGFEVTPDLVRGETREIRYRERNVGFTPLILPQGEAAEMFSPPLIFHCDIETSVGFCSDEIMKTLCGGFTVTRAWKELCLN